MMSLPSPHVPIYVNELAALTKNRASNWDGTKVRVVGRLRQFYPSQQEAQLESLPEMDGREGPFTVKVDLINADISKISNNAVVHILGEVYTSLYEDNTAIIVKTINDYGSLDCHHYAEAIKILRKRFPYFMK